MEPKGYELLKIETKIDGLEKNFHAFLRILKNTNQKKKK